MGMRRSLGEHVFDAINILFLCAASFLFIVPFAHILFSSVSDPLKLLRTPGLILWPHGFTLKGYLFALSNRNIYTGYLNTLLYVTVGTFLNLLFTSVMAYVLSRKGVLLNNLMMFLLVFTMFFSGGLVPFYLVVRGIGMYDSRLAMLIPGLVSVMNMIIMRTSFNEIPESLAESAKMDGAGHFTILFQVILPLSKALLSVIGLYYAVSHWNAWFNGSIFLRDRNKFPLQLILREILVIDDVTAKSDILLDGSEMDFYRPLVKFATTMIATLPILFIYPFIQKNFTKGVMIGSIKG
jgi:putative aldouronate transport system permease protein